MSPEEVREEVLNVLLAQLLAKQGIVSLPEVLKRLPDKSRRMPDVLVDYQGLRTIIEGKIRDSEQARKDVFDQAYKRVNEGLAHIGIAVLYSKNIRKGDTISILEDLLSQRMLEIRIVTEAGAKDWTRCHLKDLGDILRRTFEQLAEQDVVNRTAAEVDTGVTAFARFVVDKTSLLKHCAEILGIWELPKDDSAGKKGLTLKEREGIAKISGLTVLNAMIFQEILSETNSRISPLRKSLQAEDPIAEFINHWLFIVREIDYKPIFHIGAELLGIFPYSSDLIKAVMVLADKAAVVLRNRTALHHDLMGRVYHTLLADKKYLGTYYTSVSAATLLLKLALYPKNWDMDWSDVKEYEKFRIADLACGTGTLLMAASEALRDAHVHACVKKGVAPDQNILHKKILEDILYGYDVLPSALHLTASTLALRSSEVLFEDSNLYSLPLGGDDLRLGSIEFLEGKQINIPVDLFHSGAARVTGRGDETVDSSQPIAPLPELDLCVINPPFTRSVGGNLLFGSVPEKQRKLMQKKLSRLLNKRDKYGNPLVSASSTAGLGSVFVAIADRALKVGGRLGLVLPKTFLSGVAWAKTRELLARKYVVETIIVSHDPQRWNFSDNTDLSELLLIARKVENNNNRYSGNDQVKCVNLWKNPNSVSTTLICAKYINEEEPSDLETGQAAVYMDMGETIYGEIISMPWSKMKDQLWMLPFSFAQNELIRIANRLFNGEYKDPRFRERYELPMTTLNQLGRLGPDGRDIHDGFNRIKKTTSYPAFWGHDKDECINIGVGPNAYLQKLIRRKPGRPLRNADDLWAKAGNFLLSDCIRLNTQSVLSVSVNQPVLSNVWWPVALENTAFSKPLSIWFNSTLGIISMLCHRGETMGAWIRFKKPNLESMPVLDIRELSDAQLKILNDAFDEIATEPLKPFPEMENDPVRAKIDDAISEALDLPDLSVIRMLLAQEPVVCLKGLYEQ